MDIVRTGNIIEAFFWIAVSLLFFIPAILPREKHRLFCLVGGLLFFIFSLSDFYEAHTGAWWKPWWLILWNAGCFIGIIFIILWYVRLVGSLKKVLEKLHQPFFRKNKKR